MADRAKKVAQLLDKRQAEPKPDIPTKLITETQIEEIWGIPRPYMQWLRHSKGGPEYYKFGPGRAGRVFYDPNDVESWLLSMKKER